MKSQHSWLPRCPIVLGLVLLAATQSDSHTAILARIASLSEQIALTPADAMLYLERGELHRVHRDWRQAAADYERALAIDSSLRLAYFLRGRMNFEAGQLSSARDDVSRFLSEEPDHEQALLTRARIHFELGDGIAAAEDYDRLLVRCECRTPEFYLERALALSGEGREHVGEALEGLDDAIQELGPLVSLVTTAIDLEIARERYDDALKRLDAIARWMPVERSLLRRGEILALAERDEEARAAYRDALDHLETLPLRRRQSRAMRELEAVLRERSW